MAEDSIQLNEVQTLRIVTSSPDLLELEATWEPGGKPPPTHWHPSQHERFEVLEGTLTVEVDGAAQQLLTAGHVLDVPPRTAHRMWNAGAERARASWRVTPALRTEEMFRTLARGPSKAGQAKLLWTFRHEFRLGQSPGDPTS